MERLNPEKLYVEFESGVTTTDPIQGRKYTLTHSDITADLFLTIGLEFAYDEINEMRDEVLAVWQTYEGRPILYVYVYIGQYDPITTAIRDTIFRRELPLALEAIRYGDSELFTKYPELGKAPIWISFNSTNQDYDKFEYWGTMNDYE
ncbi:MAG: hypothetical protein H6Q59_461 [Firmicutes bacterium]|nr:hypothetical protein [Bacillota bacterium]